MAAAKKSASKGQATAKKSGAVATATKSPTKQAAAKKSAARTTASKKVAAKKVAAKKVATTKVAAKKVAADKVAARKVPTKQASAKKVPAKNAPANKAVAKQPAAKKTAGKQTTAPPTSSAPTAQKRDLPKMPAKKTATRPKKPLSALLSNEVPEVHEIPAPRGTTKDGITYTKDFDVKFLKAQRDELEARRASEIKRATRLEDEAESLIEGGEMGDVQFDDEGGEGDTMVVQRDLDRLLSSQARQTVQEVDEALERIRVGTYGYSVVSGLPIPRERLEALPETTVLAVEKVSGAGLR